MKLKYKIQINDIGDQSIGVAIGDDARYFSNLLFLNETGKTILELLQNDTSRPDIIKAILHIFEGDKELIEKEVNSFIDQLIDLNLIDDGIN